MPNTSDFAAGPTYRLARRSGIDPATRRLMITAGILGGALMVIVGAWSTIGPGQGGVPVIAPPPGPVRVKPADPGGMQVSNDNAILSGALALSGKDQLAPPPETPDPQALTGAPQPTPAPAPAERSMNETGATPAAASAPDAGAEPTFAPVAPAVSTPTVPKAAVPTERAAADRSLFVQLAALETKDAADGEWRSLERRLGDLLDGKTPAISRAAVNERVFWRVRTGGFADAAAARAFCERVHTKGAACTVAQF